jgi:hypothetical protein
MTPETVQKLEKAFLMGCTDMEACLYADISKTALYAYIEKNPEFHDRKEVLKQNPVMKARQVILGALKEDDVNTANKVIDRKEGTKVKQEISGPDGGPVAISEVTFVGVSTED